jgi:hypothetical protein
MVMPSAFAVLRLITNSNLDFLVPLTIKLEASRMLKERSTAISVKNTRPSHYGGVCTMAKWVPVVGFIDCLLVCSSHFTFRA